MEPTTVKIVCEDTESGWMLINESDFDPKLHKKFKEKAEKPAPTDPPLAA